MSFALLLFINGSHLLAFTSSSTRPEEKHFHIEEDQEEEEEKTGGVKQVLWDQWCKKLFLLNAAWLTFPADTDKRMGARRTF